jgi:hypothetical protein
MAQNEGAGPSLPRYQSHKIVHALKIKNIVYDFPPDSHVLGGALIEPEDERFMPFRVKHHTMFAGNPRPGPGWYYVVYPSSRDDVKPYFSFSPGEAFEEGHTKL